VGLTPIGLALIAVAVAQQEVLEAKATTAQIVDGSGPSAAQIANGLISGLGDVEAVSSPARKSRAMVRASGLSVLKGEPGCLGMSEGAATRQGTLSCLRGLAMPKAQGPAS